MYSTDGRIDNQTIPGSGKRGPAGQEEEDGRLRFEGRHEDLRREVVERDSLDGRRELVLPHQVRDKLRHDLEKHGELA